MSLNLAEAQTVLEHILIQWDHFSSHLQNMKEEELDDDLFTQIDFLSELDETRAIISSELDQLKKYLEEAEKDPESNSEFKDDAKRVLRDIGEKIEMAEEAYEEVSEEVLSRTQDRITELTDQLLEHRQKISLKDRVGLELDAENELHELRDSLEAYREIRLINLIDETGDPIIDQLNSQMAACDSALLIEESSL